MSAPTAPPQLPHSHTSPASSSPRRPSFTAQRHRRASLPAPPSALPLPSFVPRLSLSHCTPSSVDYLDLSDHLSKASTSFSTARTALLRHLVELEARLRLYAEALPDLDFDLVDGEGESGDESAQQAEREAILGPVEVARELLGHLRELKHEVFTSLPSASSLEATARRAGDDILHTLPSLPSPTAFLASVQPRLDALHARLAAFASSTSPLRALHERLPSLSSPLLKELGGHALEEAKEKWDGAMEVLDEAKRSIEEALARAQHGRKLIRFSDLPEAWKNNKHILSGYRFIPLHNKRHLFLSAFHFHNETFNIQSHLLGALAVAGLLLWHMGAPHPHWAAPDSHTGDRLMTLAFLIAALKCLVFSSLWHLHAGCADRHVFERWACVDYVGISWLIAASVGGVSYYGLYCHAPLRNVFLALVLANAIVGSFLPFAEWFNQRKNKGWRIGFFLYMACCGVAPLCTMGYIHGSERTLQFFSPIVPSLLFYIGGLVIYATQFPECFLPGKFDLFGHSHNAWHVCIVAAIFAHYQAVGSMHDARFAYACAAPDSAVSSFFSSAAPFGGVSA